LAAYPLVNVAPPVADVLSHPEAGRTLACVSPGVQGGDRHCQVFSELLRGEKAVKGIHGRIVEGHPVIGVFLECHTACHCAQMSRVLANSLPILRGDQLGVGIPELFVDSLDGVAAAGGSCASHPRILRPDPVIRVSVTLSIALQLRSAGLFGCGPVIRTPR